MVPRSFLLLCAKRKKRPFAERNSVQFGNRSEEWLNQNCERNHRSLIRPHVISDTRLVFKVSEECRRVEPQRRSVRGSKVSEDLAALSDDPNAETVRAVGDARVIERVCDVRLEQLIAWLVPEKAKRSLNIAEKGDRRHTVGGCIAPKAGTAG
jgi:hypothetical protein